MSSSQDSFPGYSDSRTPKQELDSPFLDEALFVDEEAESAEAWETRLMGLQTPFLEAFGEEYETRVEPKVEKSEAFLEKLDEEEFDEEAEEEPFADLVAEEEEELEAEEFERFLDELDEEEFDEESFADFTAEEEEELEAKEFERFLNEMDEKEFDEEGEEESFADFNSDELEGQEEQQVSSGNAPVKPKRIQKGTTTYWIRKVDKAVRKHFRLKGVGLKSRVRFVTQAQFAKRFKRFKRFYKSAILETLLNLFLTRPRKTLRILDHHKERELWLPPLYKTERYWRRRLRKLRRFITRRIKSGTFEFDQLGRSGLFVQKITPEELIAELIPGITIGRRRRRVMIQIPSDVEVLVHEACHFYTHNRFSVTVKKKASNRFFRGLRLSEILIEGFTEYFSRQVMQTNQKEFGVIGFPAYDGYVRAAKRFISTIGENTARLAFFKGNRKAIRQLFKAIELNIKYYPLLVPGFMLEAETPQSFIGELDQEKFDEIENEALANFATKEKKELETEEDEKFLDELDEEEFEEEVAEKEAFADFTTDKEELERAEFDEEWEKEEELDNEEFAISDYEFNDAAFSKDDKQEAAFAEFLADEEELDNAEFDELFDEVDEEEAFSEFVDSEEEGENLDESFHVAKENQARARTKPQPSPLFRVDFYDKYDPHFKYLGRLVIKSSRWRWQIRLINPQDLINIFNANRNRKAALSDFAVNIPGTELEQKLFPKEAGLFWLGQFDYEKIERQSVKHSLILSVDHTTKQRKQLKQLLSKAKKTQKEQGLYIILELEQSKNKARLYFKPAVGLKSEKDRIEWNFTYQVVNGKRITYLPNTGPNKGSQKQQVIGTVHTHYIEGKRLAPRVSTLDICSANKQEIVVYAIESKQTHKAMPNCTVHNKIKKKFNLLVDALESFAGKHPPISRR